MLFNSIEFLIFLPIVFTLYWAMAKHYHWQNLLVVVVSYLFYGWWDWRFLLLIAFTTLCSYLSGLMMQRHAASRTKRKIICAANITINLAILGIFKYYNFFADNFDALMTDLGLHADVPTLNLILPVGISFYTFQALSYTIDVYRGKIAVAKDVVAFFAFVTFFPQLVAGPIERASNLYPQFLKPRSFDYERAVSGCKMILWGFFKKIVIADSAAVIVNMVFADVPHHNAASLWIAAILFSFQIYGDFSGYSDIAIGVSRLFGISLMRNFNLPYLSRDIAEFWRRWHISLTTWFRDYIYIPLGGSRVSRWKVVRNVWIIFLVSGFWHGANWTFIIWGAYHALLFMPLLLLGKNRRHTGIVAERRGRPTASEAAQMLVTFLLVTIGWVIFRAADISQAADYIVRMCNITDLNMPDISKKNLFYVLECVMAIVLLLYEEWKHRTAPEAFDIRLPARPMRWAGYLAVSVWTFLFYSVGQTFIYFQF
jgi:alginate O-acetyltransferase complex protein AlgI